MNQMRSASFTKGNLLNYCCKGDRDMHIPDNYLSPETCAVMAAASIPVLAISVYKVKKELKPEKISKLGAAAAFSFLGMMFNIPLPGGSTGHAVGGTLIALILGPYAACLAVSAALILQALLFGDGGILSLGANIFNMAIVMPFAGYYASQLLKKIFHGKKGELIAGSLGSYIGINLAALCAAIEFGIQPALFHDALGNALYCPYPLSVSVPAMMIGHLTVFGLAEAIFTAALYSFIRSAAPEMMKDTVQEKISKPLAVLIGALITAVPLGLLAEGTAWGEWGIDEIASAGAGPLPAGMANGFAWQALLPDYSFASIPDWLGYVLSAAAGAAICMILFKLISTAVRKKRTLDA